MSDVATPYDNYWQCLLCLLPVKQFLAMSDMSTPRQTITGNVYYVYSLSKNYWQCLLCLLPMARFMSMSDISFAPLLVTVDMYDILYNNNVIN